MTLDGAEYRRKWKCPLCEKELLLLRLDNDELPGLAVRLGNSSLMGYAGDQRKADLYVVPIHFLDALRCSNSMTLLGSPEDTEPLAVLSDTTGGLPSREG